MLEEEEKLKGDRDLKKILGATKVQTLKEEDPFLWIVSTVMILFSDNKRHP